MPTINESELRHLIDNLRESIRGGGWSDAIAALESRLFPPHRTVPWPDEPGVWWATFSRRSEVVVAYCNECMRKVDRVVPLNGAPPHSRTTDWQFTGPLTVIVPDKKPEPGPWDYEPQSGDWVWVMRPVGDVIQKIAFIEARSGGLMPTPNYGEFLSDLKAKGWRFAKAEVSPPPESRDAKGGE